MNEYLETLVHEHYDNGLFLDANLLLLFVVGRADTRLVNSFKRLNMFSETDFETLCSVVESFGTIATTPNILTEVSNLAEGLTGVHKEACFNTLSAEISLLEEHYLPSVEVISSPAFHLFGLSDAVLVEIARRKLLFITIDLKLYHYVSSLGIDVINFNHLRSLN